ncbi:COX5B-domain-containing protein [Dacryopinax primogenitus]|uniref:COX5B-domain-containing protein n=1 Tax=Dacryopinax primogenitus (strain DJM 731) TaxID=1858805 RepID=M5GE17_DACPD|nr:COX5B-domain-containing protein [Dacryopinax primogenitus]EJU05002.1 COX5B-domain-containing protein [Dacryopinax primogenitus]
MFSLIRARAVTVAPRVSLRAVRASTAFRALSTTALRKADDHGHAQPPTPLYGEGSTPGQVPTDVDQATGLERLQLLGEIEGIDVFDQGPLEVNRLGTLADPIMVECLADERIVGCTGFPADSHDTIWLSCTIHGQNRHRCPECGCVYALDDLRPKLEEIHGEHAPALAH